MGFLLACAFRPEAARIVDEAMHLWDAGNAEGARKVITDGIARIEAYGQLDQTKYALDLLRRSLDQMVDEHTYRSSRKYMRYSSSASRSLKSDALWSGPAEHRPSFSRRTSRSSANSASARPVKEPEDSRSNEPES